LIELVNLLTAVVRLFQALLEIVALASRHRKDKKKKC
jgi:hypothetical protein